MESVRDTFPWRNKKRRRTTQMSSLTFDRETAVERGGRRIRWNPSLVISPWTNHDGIERLAALTWYCLTLKKNLFALINIKVVLSTLSLSNADEVTKVDIEVVTCSRSARARGAVKSHWCILQVYTECLVMNKSLIKRDKEEKTFSESRITYFRSLKILYRCKNIWLRKDFHQWKEDTFSDNFCCKIYMNNL